MLNVGSQTLQSAHDRGRGLVHVGQGRIGAGVVTTGMAGQGTFAGIVDPGMGIAQGGVMGRVADGGFLDLVVPMTQAAGMMVTEFVGGLGILAGDGIAHRSAKVLVIDLGRADQGRVPLQALGGGRIEDEEGHLLFQSGGGMGQGLGGGGGFLHQGGILLGHFVHLVDGGIDLIDARRLLGAGGGDFGDDIGHPLHAAQDIFQGLAGALDQIGTRTHLCRALGDQSLDFLGRLG